MHYKGLFIVSLLGMSVFGILSDKLFASRRKAQGSLYDFTVTGLNGEPVRFEKFRGKNLLIVNTASKCGYTPQYKSLQQLHEMYGDRVVVLGFPANDFLWQEPGSNSEIAEFCQRNYGVTFQMFEKISVRGRSQHPLYRWLSAKTGKRPGWNFCKYLVGKDGEVLGFYGPKVSPLDDVIINQIKD